MAARPPSVEWTPIPADVPWVAALMAPPAAPTAAAAAAAAPTEWIRLGTDGGSGARCEGVREIFLELVTQVDGSRVATHAATFYNGQWFEARW
jgi:hypothetical protein